MKKTNFFKGAQKLNLWENPLAEWHCQRITQTTGITTMLSKHS